MKNKNIHQEYQEIIDSIKAQGKTYIQEEIENLEKDFSATASLYARMGLLGRIQMHERALKELTNTEKSLEILDEAFAKH